MIQEGSKVRLKTGEIAFISEVLERGVAYVAEVFKIGKDVSIEQISHKDIVSVYIETEQPIA